MKKFNLFVMSLLATASFTLNSCSNDDAMSATSQQQSVDGFYMTLQVNGSANGTSTRTSQDPSVVKTDSGTVAESTANEGTIYIYKGTNCVFSRTITSDDWKTYPYQETKGETKPIKVSVNNVNTTDTYNVYYLANKSYTNPLATDAAFTASTTGGADYAQDNQFVMFNENDKYRQASHSTVTFTDENKSETKPAEAGTIYLDRVVARIDKPTVSVEKITQNPDETEAAKQTKHIDYIDNVNYLTYAVSNLNNNSYVVQNWTDDWSLKTLITGTPKYYKAYSVYGDKYQADGLNNFGNVEKNYCFENTTNKTDDATAMYFCIQANLTETKKNNSDFKDGTFYRYDNRIYTKLSDIVTDKEVDNPFAGAGLTAEEALNLIKGEDGKLIPEDKKADDDQDVAILPEFRQQFNIEIYREGNMYYRYLINDNNYTPTGYYSVLRNSIYRLTVDAIYDLGRDVPNGEDKDQKKPNYFLKVAVLVNPWVLNTKTIQLK